jgi:hypothetical protein
MTEKSSFAPVAQFAHNQRLFSARIGTVANILMGTTLVISSVRFNPSRTIDFASDDETMLTSENQNT